MTRRIFLGLAGLELRGWAPKAQVRLSIGTYGMRDFAVEEALERIRGIGYDGAELCLMPGWPSEPATLDPAARRRIRGMGIAIPTMIENFNLLVSEPEHQATLDRIRRAAALAQDLAPKAPPILQSVLGGKPEEWEQVKDKMAVRLGDWAGVARENHLRLAVKSHVSSASDTPEKLIWLLDRVANPAVSGIYDYGHFQLLNLDLEKTLHLLLPRSAFLTVKDGRMVDGKPRFLLPGEGSIDYAKYFALLREKGYRGWMLVEVSRQLQVMPGYDAIGAARRSYGYLAPLLHREGLR